MNNMGLIEYAIQKSFARLVTRGRMKKSGYEWNDLEQQAIMGMMRAIEKFDSTKGTSFATYAFFWIR